MCGITGFHSRKMFHQLFTDLSKATKCLGHRGPDDEGIYQNPSNGVGLGHRRLSIIDLSDAGHQPMSRDNDAVIVFNGEIYNFIPLRRQLMNKGYVFSSRSDTEILLNAYLAWGPQCLDKLIGMFAFAIWDQRNSTLFLARDRLGIKPLYYYFRDGTLIFGSELKALMAYSAFQREIDEQSIPLFLHYQYIPAPRTIFKNTFKLLPGNYILFDGTKISIKQYWSLPPATPALTKCQRYDEGELLEQLDHLLSQAVKDRLLSDVPLGSMLSGGIDSSIVAALMQKASNLPVKTFSIGFQEPGYNEAPWAKQVAGHLGTKHTELYVSPQLALDVIADLPTIYDEPFADSSSIPTLLVSRLIKEHVTVALSGDGGDEQFAGYVRYWITRVMALWQKKIPASLLKSGGLFLSRLSIDWVDKVYLSIRDHLPRQFRVANFQDKWQKLIVQMQYNQLSDFYRTTICLWPAAEINRLTGSELPESRFDSIFKTISFGPVLSQLMHIDQQTYLPDCMLTKVDRASMATGLEVRVPLLDHRVLEFTTKLPEDLKFKDGSGKYLLKKLLSRYVPDRLFERPKMGFGVPIDQWLRGPLKELLHDYLSQERLRNEGRFNASLVNQKIKEHLNGTNNHHYRLWALLMWEMWRERWMN